MISDLFTKGIKEADPEVYGTLSRELERQQNQIELIASENKLILVDNVGCDWNDGTFESNSEEEISREIKSWCELVFNPNSRFE